MRIPSGYPGSPPPQRILANSPMEREINRRIAAAGFTARFRGETLNDEDAYQIAEAARRMSQQEDVPAQRNTNPMPAENLAENEDQSLRQQLRKVQDWRRKATTTGTDLILNKTISADEAAQQLQGE